MLANLRIGNLATPLHVHCCCLWASPLYPLLRLLKNSGVLVLKKAQQVAIVRTEFIGHPMEFLDTKFDYLRNAQMLKSPTLLHCLRDDWRRPNRRDCNAYKFLAQRS